MQSLMSRLSVLSLWTNLWAIGNKPVARLVIVIPILGYWIIFNRSLESYLSLKWDREIHNTGADVPWKLLSSYFSLCFSKAAIAPYALAKRGTNKVPTN